MVIKCRYKNDLSQKSYNYKERLVILFFDYDYLEGFNHYYDDLMVITNIVHNYAIKRILVDQGCSTNILYSATTASMKNSRKVLKSYLENLVRFFGK